jgi:formate dehydrogenase subunit delta
MNSAKLIKMANQIGAFFDPMPDHDQAVTGVAAHIQRNWETRMRSALQDYVEVNGDEALMPIVREALRVVGKGGWAHMGDIATLISTVTKAIHDAFDGVPLGDGVSLRQAEIIDRFGDGCTDQEFEEIKQSEVVNDWRKVSLDELERDNVAHLDAAGFRYYLPAFMLSVIEHYDSASMRVIGTLSGLHPNSEHWAYHMDKYSLLTFEHKRAIAMFLDALPEMVLLDVEDRKIVRRALSNYWKSFLPIYVPPGA